MIPEDTINQIFEAVNIEEIVGDFVSLTKKGANYIGLCPFHNEKTPSFIVSPAKGIFKCFGCGKAGNAIGFLMEHKGMSYPEALKYTADKYGITIEEKKTTPEQKKKKDLIEKIIIFNQKATEYFQKNLFKPENKKALDYIRTRFSDETIKDFKLGFAPGGYQIFYKIAKKQGYTDEFLLSTGLFTRSKKNGKIYDLFQNRIVFPVADKAGTIISFSARVLPDADKSQAKYLNLPETQLYHKSNVLYAIDKAISSIAKTKTAILVEGNPDAVKLHQLGISNVIAPSGTAIADGQIKTLSRFAEKIILLYDGDTAGQNALKKNGKILVKKGMIPYAAVLPKEEDPESFFKNEKQFKEWIEKKKIDFIKWYSNDLFSKVGNDPSLKNDAITDITKLIVNINKTKRELYIDEITKSSKLKAKLFTDKLKELEPDKPEKEKKEEWLPEEINPNEFEKWGFYEYRNAYYFRTKEGIRKLSNFIMLPIFHIDSINDSKRIYELKNEYGYSTVVDFDMQEMTSIQAYQRNVEGRGNFLFWGTSAHFAKLKQKLYEETRTCNEIKNLGWQKEGFWAWSNGKIEENGTFTEIDEFGVVKHQDKNYFIPAFSKIYINDKSVFLDERKFKYTKRNIIFKEWAKLFIEVFGENAKIAIAYWIATIFRDHLLHVFKNFPLLNLFGPKGTGKSQMAMSMSCLYGEQQTPFNIHNGTKAGLAEHIQLFNNSFAWIDEYKNSLDYDKIETLKSIYDAIGRSRLNINKGMKKETTAVNSAVILSGQEMPTIDVALFSRMIFLQFHKTEFSKTEKDNYDKLKQMERDGLSQFTSELIKYRKYFVENYYDNYESVLANFYEATKKNNIEDRILRNMCTIVAAFKTMENKITFPFSYENLIIPAYAAIIDQNSQISKSNEVGIFWNLLEAMFDDNMIIDKWHFKLQFYDTLKTKERKLNFKEGRLILKFKFNIIHKLYAQQCRIQGIKPLPSDTLQYYLKNSKYFYGVQDKCNFSLIEFDKETGKTRKRKQNTTAFCFEYEKLGINLLRIDEEEETLNEISRSSPNHYIEPGQTAMKLAPKDNLPF